jgi:hypothetical protein
MKCCKITSIVIGLVTAFATFAIFTWLGICMLVPQAPFETRNIAGGVMLVIFSFLAFCVGGLLAWFCTGGVCLIAASCCDDDDCC